MNLITNAHEYSPEGANIGVTARVVGAELEIAVSDDGPGIPEDQLEHIFERFTRGDAGLTQRVGGTGLGLAISKSLVELHGGTIEVDSTLGPRLEPSASGCRCNGAASRLEADARDRGAGPMTTVLVADDSETILLLMRTRLELAGYEVETAADGQEVTELVGGRGGPGPTCSCSTR